MKAKEKKAMEEKRIQHCDLSLPTVGNEEMLVVVGNIRDTRPGNLPLEDEKHLPAYAGLDKSVGETEWEKNPGGLLWIPSRTAIRNQ